MNRRSALVLLLSTAAAGCGFKLRGRADLAFKTLYLGFAPASAIGAELRRWVRIGSNTQVVSDPQQADAVLDVFAEERYKQILSLTAQGLVREYRLNTKLKFRLHDGQGKEFIPISEIVVFREVTFNDTAVLAKDAEDTLLYTDMNRDIVQQLMRRLEAVKPDGGR